VRSLEVILLSRNGQEDKALALARKALQANVIDYDLLNVTFGLARRAADYPLAIRAMELRIQGWPQSRAGGYLQLGSLYATDMRDPQKAAQAYRNLIESTPPAERDEALQQVPAQFRDKLGPVGSMPAASTQMSVISR
jgi:O-antigen ligase